MARFTSKLSLILGLCAAVALANGIIERPAEIPSTIPRKDVIDRVDDVLLCPCGGCAPRVFVPTTEFQEIYEGQQVPPGLHFKFDMANGKKYAKLIDPTEANNKDTKAIVIEDIKTPGTYLHKVGESDNNEKSVAPSPSADTTSEDTRSEDTTTDHDKLEEESSRMRLQEAFDSITDFSQFENSDSQPQQQSKPAVPSNKAQPPKPIVPVSVEQQLFQEQLEIVKTSNDHEAILGALEELQDLASDMDFGLQLSTAQKLNILVNRLCCGEKSDVDCNETRLIRSKAALVIGTAVQNHEKAQSAAFKLNLHEFLMNRLETDPDQQVLRKLIFAYGNLVRGGHSRFIQDEDIVRLAKLYKESTDPEFRRKCVYIMSDFADPDMQFAEPDSTGEKEEEENVTQPTVKKPNVNVGPWCETLRRESRTNKDGEDGKIIEHAVELLNASYPDTCTPSKNTVKEEL